MNTTINSVRFKADEKLEKFINDKVAKLDRMIDNAIRCEVTLKVEKPESDAPDAIDAPIDRQRPLRHEAGRHL